MKRAILTIILSLGLIFPGIAMAPQAQASQVFCRVPAAHRVTCWNYTPYRIYIRVVAQTSAGRKAFAGWMKYTKWSHYFTPVVYSVRWSWHY